MNPVAATRSWSRWLIYVAIWLLLSCVFASQLFLAGYVTRWSWAFAGELVYWLSWGAMLPFVFWWCRRLREFHFAIRLSGLVLGAFVTALLGPLFAQAIVKGVSSMGLCQGNCGLVAQPFSGSWLRQAVRVAGINLPVYAGFVLAWHAATFFREARDRQMKAVELQALLQRAQLDALRSQLNPHFLFNTLHSIAELVHSNPKLAEQLIVRLGELLRQVLQTSTRQELTLAEELEFIRGYVDIEQMRLGERLRVTWDIQPEALQSRVPGLILQPLVENAIQHGIAACEGPGTLTIRARRVADELHIEVADSGPGLAPSQTKRPQGIGLANTQARLQSLYGGRQAFELQNGNGGGNGLRVLLRLPAAGA